MEQKKLTYVDVLEEMQVVFDSVVEDIANIVPFEGKAQLLLHAVTLAECCRRARWFHEAPGIDYNSELTGIRDEEELPF